MQRYSPPHPRHTLLPCSSPRTLPRARAGDVLKCAWSATRGAGVAINLLTSADVAKAREIEAFYSTNIAPLPRELDQLMG